MVSEARLWLTLPKRVVAFACTVALPGAVPRTPLIFVVPPLVTSVL